MQDGLSGGVVQWIPGSPGTSGNDPAGTEDGSESAAPAPGEPSASERSSHDTQAQLAQAVESVRGLFPYLGDEDPPHAADMVAVFREMAEAEETAGPETTRALAFALGVRSLHRFALGYVEGGLRDGREAVALRRRVLDATPAESTEYDEVVADLSRTLNDIAPLTLAAGNTEEHRRMRDSAVHVAGLSDGPAARRALGCALHNAVAARTVAYATVLAAGGNDPAEVADMLDTARKAVALLQPLVDPDLSVTSYEFASAQATLGRLLCLTGDPLGGLHVLTAATHHAEAARGLPAYSQLSERMREDLHMATTSLNS